MTQSPRPPHPENVPGDFYVEDGCCITCGVPLDEAPDVFAWAQGPHGQCVVAAQPETPDAVDRTIAAMWAGEVSCVRYRGTEPAVARRIVEMGLAELCDHPPPKDARPLIRSHVSFGAVDGDAPMDARLVAERFRDHFKQKLDATLARLPNPPSSFWIGGTKEVRGGGSRASVQIAWVQDAYHSVEFSRQKDGRWLAVAKPKMPIAGTGLSRTIDRWLKADPLFEDIRWYSAQQWRAGGPFRSTVI